MRAMVLRGQGRPLEWSEVAQPVPAAQQILIKVRACAVCRTDLHILDAELRSPKLPLIPGHEVVGVVEGAGPGANRFKPGDRVGVPWLGWACGVCEYCRKGRENLCEQALFTGYTRDGGYADYAVADERFCFKIPNTYGDTEAAPLLCAGLIGFRALSKAGNAQRLGLYGFGAAAHLITQVAQAQKREVYAFTRPGDLAGQKFARSLGACWAGDSDRPAPHPLDAAIIFAPVGALVPQALKAVAKGGTVVCGGIHMSDIPAFSYELLWEERSVHSVANLTRQDGEGFMALAAQVKLSVAVETFPLSAANQALESLRSGRVQGAAVLVTA